MSTKEIEHPPGSFAPAMRLPLIYGWVALAGFIVFGLYLESLHLFKAPFYLEVALRRELWTLAHAHGGLLAILNLLFALCGNALAWAGQGARRAALAMVAGGALVPAGFLLGGIGNSEVDPSLWIALTPVGALLLLGAVLYAAIRTLRR